MRKIISHQLLEKQKKETPKNKYQVKRKIKKNRFFVLFVIFFFFKHR